MTNDPLDRLDRALRRHTPAPRDTAREAALRAAMAGFETAAQGSAEAARHTLDRPQRAAWIRRGVTTMLRHLNSHRLLTATSALATGVIAVVAIQNIGPMELSPRVGGPVLSDAAPETASGFRAEYIDGADERAGVTIRRAVQPPGPFPEPVFEVDPGQAELLELESQALVTGRSNEMRRILQDRAAAPDHDLLAAPMRPRSALTAPEERLVPDALRPAPEASTERYPDVDTNPLKRVLEEPVSTFSIDVDTAAYGVVRSSLQAGHLPPRDAVRVEELVNYFDYAYPAPESAGVPFRTSVSVAPTPWNPDTRLLHIGLQGYESAERPPLNLVFLIDTSGSMDDPRKLPLLKQSFRLLVESLRPEDSIAIVTYAGSAGMALAPTPASERAAILSSLERLSAGGSTAGQAGLQQAYALAAEMAEEGEISRVILATDGDFNVGISSAEGLRAFVEEKRESGTYLSVLGFGRGNYNDAVMQSLAQHGNGTAAYIDTLAEAQKVLVEEMTANLFPIAGDVKIQIEFNPAQISEYRLIGYETRALNREDFANDAVDAGEIGAGHRVTALYEITPKGSPAERISDLRYAEAEARDTAAEASPELAFLKLRYKRPGEDRSQLVETAILPDRADIPAGETGFAAAVAGFGGLLRGESFLGEWDYRDALALASASRGEDPYGYRAEFLTLVRLADALD